MVVRRKKNGKDVNTGVSKRPAINQYMPKDEPKINCPKKSRSALQSCGLTLHILNDDIKNFTQRGAVG